MRQRSISKQIGKPITITEKNIGRILKRAIKVLKKNDREPFIVFKPEEYWQANRHFLMQAYKISHLEFDRMLKNGYAGKFKLKRGIIKK